eukprot:4838456-Amphidinium_carterae.1
MMLRPVVACIPLQLIVFSLVPKASGELGRQVEMWGSFLVSLNRCMASRLTKTMTTSTGEPASCRRHSLQQQYCSSVEVSYRFRTK